jgi:hypothetical protein
MKHKVKVQVPVKKRGLLGFEKTVMETRIIEVDDKTYRKMQMQQKERPYILQPVPTSLIEKTAFGNIAFVMSRSPFLWEVRSACSIASSK